ncbi:8585_t:CDS:2, partial [Rhizophagus irregularis]
MSNEYEKLKSYLPDDDKEINRHHTHHFLKRCLFENNFSSPIEQKLIRNQCKVLDVACGAGTWLLDLSINYPKSNFFGLDKKPLFPKEIKPENLQFIQADILNGLPYPDDEFDFVHQETMILAYTPDQWNFVISELVRVTKPGGWIELVEPYSFAIGAGPLFVEFYTSACETFLSKGIDVKIIQQLESMLESNLNLSNVRKDEKTFILGSNGDKIGEAYLDYIFKDSANSEIIIRSISHYMGISNEKYLKVIDNLIEELDNSHMEFMIYRIYAQKNDENNVEVENEDENEGENEERVNEEENESYNEEENGKVNEIDIEKKNEKDNERENEEWYSAEENEGYDEEENEKDIEKKSDEENEREDDEEEDNEEENEGYNKENGMDNEKRNDENNERENEERNDEEENENCNEEENGKENEKDIEKNEKNNERENEEDS